MSQQSGLTLFTCGSFSEGMLHYKKIEAFINNQISGTIQAAVYKLPVGLPVLMDDPIHQVQGVILDLKASPLLNSILDEFHGYNALKPEDGLFLKKEVLAQVPGAMMPAHVYFINPLKLPKGSKLIAQGNWMDNLKVEPPLTEKLSERQKTYIKRLGTSSGRDIVPIDLNMYRELMGLEIVRDKGRRLALTNLGQEVLRYLE